MNELLFGSLLMPQNRNQNITRIHLFNIQFLEKVFRQDEGQSAIATSATFVGDVTSDMVMVLLSCFVNTTFASYFVFARFACLLVQMAGNRRLFFCNFSSFIKLSFSYEERMRRWKKGTFVHDYCRQVFFLYFLWKRLSPRLKIWREDVVQFVPSQRQLQRAQWR